MNNVMADDPARQAIRKLMRVTAVQELRQILIQPEGLKLTVRRVHMDEINRENVEGWLEELRTLLQTLEDSPDPQEITVAIPIEKEIHLDRKSLAILGAAVGFSTLAALSVCMIAIAVIIRVLSNIP